MIEENERLSKSEKSLIEENAKVKKEIEILKSTAEKYIFSFENIQLMMKSQKSIFHNAKISLNSLRK